MGKYLVRPQYAQHIVRSPWIFHYALCEAIVCSSFVDFLLSFNVKNFRFYLSTKKHLEAHFRSEFDEFLDGWRPLVLMLITHFLITFRL